MLQNAACMQQALRMLSCVCMRRCLQEELLLPLMHLLMVLLLR